VEVESRHTYYSLYSAFLHTAVAVAEPLLEILMKTDSFQ